MTPAIFLSDFLPEQATQVEAFIACVNVRYGSSRNHLAVFPLAV